MSVGGGLQPFERYECVACGAHNPPRDPPYCTVCGSEELRPVEGPPLITRAGGQQHETPAEREG
jgi:ribosomal protein L40E